MVNTWGRRQRDISGARTMSLLASWKWVHGQRGKWQREFCKRKMIGTCSSRYQMVKWSRLIKRDCWRGLQNWKNMYLSDRDLRWAIECGRLIVDPPPQRIESTSIDLHLDSVDEAKVWDVAAFGDEASVTGQERSELRIGKFDYRRFSGRYLKPP